jgi:hypothetical protein
MAQAVSRGELLQAFNDAVETDVGASAAEAITAEGLPGDAKQFFCQNWPMIKQVLQFIGDQVGGIVKIAIRGIVAAGDLLHGRVC